jgi:hypothetical protein
VLLDHFVFVVRSLTDGVEEMRGLGFGEPERGSHPRFGSLNALYGLADGCYLELFSFAEQGSAQREHPLWTAYERGGGFAVYWLRCDDVGAARSKLVEAGFAYDEILDLDRRKERGGAVRFRVAAPTGGVPWLPFLIQDLDGEGARVPELTTHPNGARGVGRLAVLCPDAAMHSRIFDALGVMSRESQAPAGLHRTTALLGTGTLEYRFEPGAAGALNISGGPEELQLVGLDRSVRGGTISSFLSTGPRPR